MSRKTARSVRYGQESIVASIETLNRQLYAINSDRHQNQRQKGLAALREMKAFRSEYSHLTELDETFRTIDKAIQRLKGDLAPNASNIRTPFKLALPYASRCPSQPRKGWMQREAMTIAKSWGTGIPATPADTGNLRAGTRMELGSCMSITRNSTAS